MICRYCLSILCAGRLSAAQDDCQARPGDDPWDKVRSAIDKFPLIHQALFTVGNASGEIFSYAKGALSPDTEQHMYSSTVWVAGVSILKEVERGVLQLDVPISEYLDYWTTDPADSRSNITLRHLLGFSSGYVDITQAGGFLRPLSCIRSSLQRCARAVHDELAHKHIPGVIIEYNNIHLTLAGAIAETATGMSMVRIIQRNVLGPSGTTNRTYFGLGNGRDDFPFLSGGLISTPRDYSAFVGALFRGELLGEDVRAEMMTDAWPSTRKRGLLMNAHVRYGLVTWFECTKFQNARPWDFTQECLDARIYSCPGLSGSYPVIDLRNQYYYHFAFDGAPGLGAAFSMLFRDTLKPLVDAAVTGIITNVSIDVAATRIACLEGARDKILGRAWDNEVDGLAIAVKQVSDCQ